MSDTDDRVALDHREMLRTQAYGTSKKLQARQTLWAFVEQGASTSRIAQAVDLSGDEMILDVGCGNGADLRALRREGHRGPLIALDLSLGMVSELEGELAARVVSDAAQLAIVSDVADVVSAMHMLYHVSDIAGALVEIRRVLRPEGVFLASTNSRETAPELRKPWSEAMVRFGGPPLVGNSERRFSLEVGSEILARVFSSVEVQVATARSLVPDARIVRDYVASTDDLFAPMMPSQTAWSNVLDAVETYATEVIEKQGMFLVTAKHGVFICRGSASRS